MKTWITVTMACVMAAGTAMAQDGFGDRPRRSPDAVIEALNLTGEQVSALRDLRRSQFEAMRPLGGEVRELGRQLREEMSKESPIPTAAGQFLVDMKTKRDEIKALTQQFQDQARGLLDENQLAALNELESGREMGQAIRQATGLGLLSPQEGGFRGRGGPGGFGGRGFGMRRFGGHRGGFGGGHGGGFGGGHGETTF